MATDALKTNMDMLNGPLGRKILRFAVPLAATSILQQLFNAADIAVVGQFAGDKALAAVGANTFVINMHMPMKPFFNFKCPTNNCR